MKQEHNNVDGEALSEANQCIALGVGVGGLGAGAALGPRCDVSALRDRRTGSHRLGAHQTALRTALIDRKR